MNTNKRATPHEPYSLVNQKKHTQMEREKIVENMTTDTLHTLKVSLRSHWIPNALKSY